MRVLGWNTTETANKDPPPPLPQAGSPTDAVETLRGRVVEAHNSSSGRDPAFASLMAEWDLIFSFKCMERAAAQEVEVQRTVSAILASRLTHALDEQKSMRAAVESKDAQLTAAVHELVTLRSHTGITQDVGSRLTALEKERNSLVTQLVELRTQYDTETTKLKEQVQSWEHSGRNTKSVEERLEQVSQELKERREQDTATERKLAEWKAKVGVALREAKEKERELNARIDELVFEARELKEERDNLSGKIRDKAEMVDREVQADETTVAGNASQSSMDVLISVRYFMPDETYLESKVSVKDCITIDELIEICCRKISIKANLSLDPTELCLVFAMANQIRSMQNMQNAKGGAFKKEYVLTGTRQLKSWTVFRQFIISNVAVVLCLETKRSASPKANFFSPKMHSKGLQSRTNSISSAAGFGLARTIGENSPCLDTTAEGG